MYNRGHWESAVAERSRLGEDDHDPGPELCAEIGAWKWAKDQTLVPPSAQARRLIRASIASYVRPVFINLSRDVAELLGPGAVRLMRAEDRKRYEEAYCELTGDADWPEWRGDNAEKTAHQRVRQALRV